MSLCINPRCPQPDHPDNSLSQYCAACGSDLLLHGRLRVMRLLSSHSGFGQVYEAFERGTPKILKVLKQAHSHNSKVLELFQREATVLGQLNHPGVPKVDANSYFTYYPKDAAEPIHCIEMEKIDGPNLKQWMVQQGNHPVGNQQALLWLTQLVDVLHLIHQRNYFHRDIKPENVMLRSMGQLVLVDFGAAREMTDTYVAHLGASGITTISSTGYTPPEQEQGQAVPQSDFYALGRTMIYLLTAKSPADPAIYDSRVNELNWRQFAPQVVPGFADLIDEMTAPRAIDRPQTTEELLDRLRAIRQSATAASTPAPAPSQPVTWPETTLNGAGSGTVLQKSKIPHKSKLYMGVIGGVGIAALALVGIGSLVAGSSWRSFLPGEVRSATPTQQVDRIKTLPGHTGSIQDLFLLSDQETLITGSADRTIRIWNIVNEAQIDELTGHVSFVNAVDKTPDQTRLISGSADGSIIFWDLNTGTALRTLEGVHEGTINNVTVSPDGRYVASADSLGSIKLWELATGELVRTLTGHATAVNDLEFNHDSQKLVSVGQSLRLWDTATGESRIIYKTEGSFMNGAAISRDNRKLITVGADKMIRLWELPSGEPLASLQGHESFINDVVISPDGQLFYTAGADKQVWVWDMESRTPLSVLTGFDSDIYRFWVRFAADQIITVGGDNTIKIWTYPDSFD